MVMEEVGRGEYVQNTLHEILKELIKKLERARMRGRERRGSKPAQGKRDLHGHHRQDDRVGEGSRAFSEKFPNKEKYLTFILGWGWGQESPHHVI